ncbi:hypothetical protein [Methylobacterium sp. ID0610]|uniref:hypothetical protein n=1 Tax=Methylobacterium carpenticola TaxID=3344827 RepID=UPI0036BDC4BC
MTKRERHSDDPGCRLNASAKDDQQSTRSCRADRLRRIEAVLGTRLDALPNEVPADGSAGPLSLENQSVELVRAFSRISDPDTRQHLLDLVLATARRLGKGD